MIYQEAIRFVRDCSNYFSSLSEKAFEEDREDDGNAYTLNANLMWEVSEYIASLDRQIEGLRVRVRDLENHPPVPAERVAVVPGPIPVQGRRHPPEPVNWFQFHAQPLPQINLDEAEGF